MFNAKSALNTTSIYARSKPNSGWTDQLRFCNIPFCVGLGSCTNCIIMKNPLYDSWMANSKFSLILQGGFIKNQIQDKKSNFGVIWGNFGSKQVIQGRFSPVSWRFFQTCLVPGDTASSSRLYDAIRQGSIPIIIGNHQFEVGLPFLWKVQWRDLAFFIPDHFDADFIKKSLRAIENYPVKLLEKRWQVLMKFKNDVSWASTESKVVKNVLREAQWRCSEWIV